MPVIPKHPGEQFEISFDFNGDLNSTESILLIASSATAVDKAGDPATADIIVPSSLRLSGSTLYLIIKGGTYELSPYTITLEAGTDENGQAYEHNIFVTAE